MAKPKLSPLKPVNLTPYEGIPVVGVSLEVSNTGYGLEQSMAMEPVELHHGQVVHLLFRTTVDKLRYDHVDRDDLSAGLVRAQVLRAEEAVLVDPEVVAEVLEEHRRKLDEAAGTPQITGFNGEVGDSGTPADDGFMDPEPLPAVSKMAAKRAAKDAAARAAGEVGSDAGASDPD